MRTSLRFTYAGTRPDASLSSGVMHQFARYGCAVDYLVSDVGGKTFLVAARPSRFQPPIVRTFMTADECLKPHLRFTGLPHCEGQLVKKTGSLKIFALAVTVFDELMSYLTFKFKKANALAKQTDKQTNVADKIAHYLSHHLANLICSIPFTLPFAVLTAIFEASRMADSDSYIVDDKKKVPVV